MQFDAGRVRRFQGEKYFSIQERETAFHLLWVIKKAEFFARQAMAYPIKRQKQDDRTTSGLGRAFKIF